MAIIEVNWRPGNRELRQFSAAWLVFFGLIGGLRLWNEPAGVAGIVLCVVAGIGLFGLVWPAPMRVLYVVATAIALPIGWVVSHVLMGVVYFGVFTLIGLCLRLAGHDPLRRKFDRGAKTYWHPRKGNGDAERYFKQF